MYVVHGMGGMGKTQLAIEYARRHAHEYSATIWVNGNTKAQLHQSLLDFLHRVPTEQLSSHLIPVLKQSPDDSGGEEASDIKHDIVVKEVKRWLSMKANRRWLMIVDNVDREHEVGFSSPSEPPFASVVKLFPRAEHGHIIVTSRLSSFKAQFSHGLKLTEMSSEDARAILKQRLTEHGKFPRSIESYSADLDRRHRDAP